ncbi:E3 ubiquitin-protein ligase TRAIP-like isoform X1 [Planococcus citri]|uniref:E3 ubiquitin-protein ligase TRAIP-like isoform X1 n=2 Tax=Planococcus citri TaxID=170843 RepID=UPI0031F88837
MIRMMLNEPEFHFERFDYTYPCNLIHYRSVELNCLPKMNVLISCTICQEDLFTGEDDESISSTNCGHVYHSHCLLQWMERSKTCPYCRTVLENDGVFKLNLLLEKTPAVPSTVKFEEFGNRVKLLCKNVKSDLKRAVERRVTKCNELRISINELEKFVLQYIGDTESDVSKELSETINEILKTMESVYERAELASERLRTKNKELENRVQCLLRSESSLKNEVAAKNKKLQKKKEDIETANLMNEKLKEKNEELESGIKEHLDTTDYLNDMLERETDRWEMAREELAEANLASEKLMEKNEELKLSIEQHLKVEADLKKKLNTETAALKNVTENLRKANLANKELKAEKQEYEVDNLKSKDKIEKLAKYLREQKKSISLELEKISENREKLERTVRPKKKETENQATYTRIEEKRCNAGN